MLKTYLKDNHISMYKLSNTSGVPYSTLNDLVNHKLPVGNMKSGQLYDISKALNISMNELYEMCLYTCIIHSEKYKTTARVGIKHKTYYLYFEHNGQSYEEEVIPVKSEATRLIRTLSVWKLEELLSRLAMKEAYETIYSEKNR